MDEDIFFNGKTQKAGYIEQVLEEYRGNPLIEALPPIYPKDVVIDMLTVDPGFNENEIYLDSHYRYHCIQRLFKYFQPLDIHMKIEQKISRAIRQGYLSRNPLGRDYAVKLQEGYKLIKNISYDFNYSISTRATASGFTIIGTSGVGKTTAVERVLSMYPQIIVHSKYNGRNLSLYQLTWMKLDCPFDGSLKGLCVNFFHELDNLLGTKYCDKFGSGKNPIDTMLPRMAQLANLHCLGVLVVDEIQHLNLAKSGGSDKMLNFFVTLVNTIGVPVVLIGTTKALSVLQGEFRQARRGSGQGDLIWERMENNAYWELLIKAMWKYQWTRNKSPLTDDLQHILYDESQGIIDIAVKLYALSQMKAIATGKEIITPSIIRDVAKESLKLVRPMLEALKSGDLHQIAKYDDIRPVNLEEYIEDLKMQVYCFPEEIKNTRKELKDNMNHKSQPFKKPKTVCTRVDADDLRHIVDTGRKNRLTAYEALKSSGYVKNPLDEFLM